MSDVPAAPDRCSLQHRGFTYFGEIQFRRSLADNTPVMVVPLGGREASMPLRSVQRELGIADDSADGRMLGLIAESLDFVSGLRLGDALPTEVLTGEASWLPTAAHRARAMARLQMQLVAWLGVETGDTSLVTQGLSAERIENDPALRAALLTAFDRATHTLGLRDPKAVIRLLEEIAEELAYIEALREALLGRVQAVFAAIERLASTPVRGDSTRLNALTQSHRLAARAVRQFAQRFAEVDAQTSEVISMLRNVEGQRVFIRSNRDWLYRTRLAWDGILAEWQTPPRQLNEASWALIARTYHFLAPRFMPVQEWHVVNRTRGAKRSREPENAMQW
jgi:hypothetical protein